MTELINAMQVTLQSICLTLVMPGLNGNLFNPVHLTKQHRLRYRMAARERTTGCVAVETNIM